MDITRTKDKSPRVGDVFDFIEQRTPEALEKIFGAELIEPANWSEELVPHTRAELIELGVQAATTGGMVGGTAQADLSDKL